MHVPMALQLPARERCGVWRLASEQEKDLPRGACAPRVVMQGEEVPMCEED